MKKNCFRNFLLTSLLSIAGVFVASNVLVQKAKDNNLNAKEAQATDVRRIYLVDQMNARNDAVFYFGTNTSGAPDGVEFTNLRYYDKGSGNWNALYYADIPTSTTSGRVLRSNTDKTSVWNYTDTINIGSSKNVTYLTGWNGSVMNSSTTSFYVNFYTGSTSNNMTWDVSSNKWTYTTSLLSENTQMYVQATIDDQNYYMGYVSDVSAAVPDCTQGDNLVYQDGHQVYKLNSKAGTYTINIGGNNLFIYGDPTYDWGTNSSMSFVPSPGPYTITYDRNKSTGLQATQTKNYGVDVSAYTKDELVEEDSGWESSTYKRFLHWNTEYDDTGDVIEEGGAIDTDDSFYLYYIEDWYNYRYRIDSGSWITLVQNDTGKGEGIKVQFSPSAAQSLPQGGFISFQYSANGGTTWSDLSSVTFEGNYNTSTGIQTTTFDTIYLKITDSDTFSCWVPYMSERSILVCDSPTGTTGDEYPMIGVSSTETVTISEVYVEAGQYVRRRYSGTPYQTYYKGHGGTLDCFENIEGNSAVLCKITGYYTIYNQAGNTSSWWDIWVNRNDKVYTLTLDNLDATTSGTTSVYENYGYGYCSDSAGSTVITSITVPTKTNSTGLNAVFGGYYTEQGGNGTQVIDSTGNILTDNTDFTSNVTLYAKWTVTFTFDCNVSQGGTGGQFTKDAVLNGGTFTIPTKGDLKKVGYKLNKDNAWNANQDGSSKTIYLRMPSSIGGSEVKSLYEEGANVFYANWTSKEEDIAIGAGNFNRYVGAICDESGTSTDFSALKTEWDWWAFQINEDDLYWMREDRSSDTRILTMLEKYDYILGKYGYGEGEGQLKDFLNRKPVVKQASNNVMMLFNLNDDSNYTLSITLISSTVALLVTTGLSLLVIKNHKTRKQD